MPEAESSDAAAEPKGKFRLSETQRNAVGIGGIILLVLALWWLWNWWSFGRFQVSTNNAYLHADTVVVAPKVAGYVEKVLVHANQQVKQGDLLLELDPRGQVRQPEAEPRRSVGVIRASPIGGARRLRHQANALIIADRLDMHARARAHFANGRHTSCSCSHYRFYA